VQVSPRLRHKLRVFHFERLEARIRLELADLLELPPDAIEFVDWAQHDALLERRRSIYNAAQAGRVPLLERQWEYEEGERLNESLHRLARLAAGYSGYFFMARYIADFAPYRGYTAKCEAPMVRLPSISVVLANAVEILNTHPYDYFELVLDETQQIITFDLSELFDLDRLPHSWTAYTIGGVGDTAAQWVAQL